MLLTPIFQWGFAGLAAILLVIIVWMIKKLLEQLANSNAIIAENTMVIRELTRLTTDELILLRGINDELLKRPCIALFRQVIGEKPKQKSD
jgi:hypothetical protein